MEYNVIDIDPAMNYETGQEVIGTVEAVSADEAIAKVLKAIGVDVLKVYDPNEYAAHILKYVEAVPKQAKPLFPQTFGSQHSIQ